MPSASQALSLANARLPRWLLPNDWPMTQGMPALATIDIERGRVAALSPTDPQMAAAHASQPGMRTEPQPAARHDLQGALVLPGFVDAHVHLDKSFTLPRMGVVQPGLLGAIDAMLDDRSRWTADDVRQRATQGLAWAYESGTVRLRTHVDWWEPEGEPVAWPVMAELAQAWHGRIQLEQVALIKLTLFEDRAQARALAARVKASGPQALLGGFVHSTNWDEAALRHLLEEAQAQDLDVDLHVDEELHAAAAGLEAVARISREIGFEGRIVCGHCCALAAQPTGQALATLDAVALAPITLVSLPATNLLLQDAVTGRTPTARGITLVKEARARGIPLLFASDNVQDPFCRFGSFDPVEALGTGALAAQLDAPFDEASESICRGDWLARGTLPGHAPAWIGAPADLVVFTQANAPGWPSRSSPRVVLRGGVPVAPAPAPSFFDDIHRGHPCSTATSLPTASCPT